MTHFVFHASQLRMRCDIKRLDAAQLSRNCEVALLNLQASPQPPFYYREARGKPRLRARRTPTGQKHPHKCRRVSPPPTELFLSQDHSPEVPQRRKTLSKRDFPKWAEPFFG